ncbi:MAG: HEAT repeat domain-containing protein [Myxococcota bacterium]
MRVVAGLAIAALVVSVVSIWVMARGLRELREEQAALSEEFRALRASNPDVAALREGPSGQPATFAAGSALERGPAPIALMEPGEVSALDLEKSPLWSDSPSEAEDAEVANARAAVLARLEAPSESPGDEVLEQLALFARMGRGEAREALMDALGDPDPDVRKQAVEALAELGDDDAVDSVSELARDPDPGVRKTLAKELGSSGNATAGPVLQRMLRDESPSVVEETLKSIADLHYQPALRDVEDFTKDEDLEIAGAAGRAQRALGDDQGAENTIEYLSRFLASDDRDERSTALSQIGKLGGERAIELLERALEDPDPKIRAKAHWYLAELE